jgi:hypothetical protein
MDGRARLRRAETRFPGKKSRLDRVSPCLSPPSPTHCRFRRFSLDNSNLYANLSALRTRQAWADGGGANSGFASHCGLPGRHRPGEGWRTADFTPRRKVAKPQGVARATCPFLPGNLPGSGFGRVARNHRRVACATRCVGLFMPSADGPEAGGIPHPARNPSIL